MTQVTPLLDIKEMHLPSHPGVYRFYNKRRALLYVGKSINIAQRVRSHFYASSQDSKEARLTRHTTHIDWTLTAGDIGALLLENRQIKSLHPLYNRRLRKTRQLWTLQPRPAAGNEKVEIEIHALSTDQAQPELFGLFASKAMALKQLKSLAAEFRLCERLLGLERGKGRCFGQQIGRCLGACCDKEPLQQHNQRLYMALASQQLTAWPWPSSLAIEEPNRIDPTRSDWHLINQWAYLGTTTHPDKLALIEQQSVPESFDLDTYFILQKSFKQPALNTFLWQNDRLEALPSRARSTPNLTPKTRNKRRRLS